MSTRANVIIKDQHNQIIFYRHSDGYPSVTGNSLKQFVKGYDTKMRRDPMQSAGWLVLQGHQEYLADSSPGDWKVGAYEPTDQLHCDIDYLWVIDLAKGVLSCRQTTGQYWDTPTLGNTKPCSEFPAYPFGSNGP